MARSEVEPGYLGWREGGVAGARGEDHGSLAKGRLAHRAVGGSEFKQVETVEDLTPSCNPTEHTLELNVQHGTPLFQAFGAPRPNGRRHCGRPPSTTVQQASSFTAEALVQVRAQLSQLAKIGGVGLMLRSLRVCQRQSCRVPGLVQVRRAWEPLLGSKASRTSSLCGSRRPQQR
ncbi:hypothetical protein JG688_00000097 [Phytophthora aleatoria]|uniref:Uncharacterized protein n=1 Tax=Phytophthora aleatoria TaxID=2496075 RepID=A0A8J5J3Y4_9STRA|nr:hypothetical protein JG688_00000097 [Phytophthora aleatoria]